MALLELNNISKCYDQKTPALNNVSFSVEEGEFVAVIGPSGAGKSTLLRCINRMIETSAGEIIFDGVNVCQANKKELRRLRTRMGMIFQHYNLVDSLTVVENVLHGRLGYKSTLAGVLGRYDSEERERAFRIIEILGLNEQIYQRCDRLSGGQKQRVGIARALVQDPKLILCDEPIASLDPNAAKLIMDNLRNICSKMKITVLINLHQVHAALKYSDRIIGIKEGKLVYDGTAKLFSDEQIQDIYGSESGELIIDWEKRSAS